MAQIIVPNEDVLVGGWSPTPLYQQINTETPNDATFVSSFSNPTNQEFRVGLVDPDTPAVRTDHIVRYRYAKDSSSGRQIDLTVALRDSSTATVIATWTHVNISDVVTQQNQTLSEAQANNISDYSALVLAFTANAVGGGGGRSCRVHWGQMEVPDSDPSTKTVTSYVGPIVSNASVLKLARFTDFSEYTTGVQPSGWTARWGTSNSTWTVQDVVGAEGGKVLRHASTASARRHISWNNADVSDVEVVGKMRLSNNPEFDNFQLSARGAGAAGTETAYQLMQRGVGTLAFRKLLNGTSTIIGTELPMTWQANVWYWLRFRIIGNTLQGKVWLDGNSEPGSWQMEHTDTTSPITAAGWTGFGAFTSAAIQEFDLIGIGFNGDEAPTESAVVGERTVTSYVGVIQGEVLTEKVVARTVTAHMNQVHGEAVRIGFREYSVTAYINQIHSEVERTGTGERTVTGYVVRIRGVAVRGRRFFTSFDEYTADAQPSDWTQRWYTNNSQFLVRDKAAASNGRVLEFSASETNPRLLSWNDAPSEADVEIVARVRAEFEALFQIRLVLRASGVAGTERGYVLALSDNSTLRLVHHDGTETLEIISQVPFSWDVGDFVFFRFRAFGNQLQGRAWLAADPEPLTWLIDTTHNAINQGGWVGVAGYNHLAGLVDFDYVGIATLGVEAPLAQIQIAERNVNAYVATIQSEAVRDGLLGERIVTAYIPNIFAESEHAGTGAREVNTYAVNFHGEAVSARHRTVLVSSFVAPVLGDAERFISTTQDVYAYLADIESSAQLRVSLQANSYVVVIISEAQREGSGTRTVDAYITAVYSEAKREGVGTRTVTGYIDTINSESESVTLIEKIVTTYLAAVHGEVERTGTGERMVEAFLEAFMSAAQVEARPAATSYIAESHSEAVREGAGERVLVAFIPAITSEAESELSGFETVTSYVQQIHSAIVLEVDATVTSFINNIVSAAQAAVSVVADSYVTRIEGETVRTGAGTRMVTSYVETLDTNAERAANSTATVTAYVTEIHGEVIREGSGERVVISFTNTIISDARAVWQIQRTVDAFINTIYSESVRQAIADETVTSYIRHIFSRAFSGEVPPLLEFDIDFGELVSVSEIDLGTLTDSLLIDLGELISGDLIKLGELEHGGGHGHE